MLNRHIDNPFHLMIGGGDQVYADDTFNLPVLKEWGEREDWEEKLKVQFTDEMREEVRRYYFYLYVSYWSSPDLRLPLASIPACFTLDDHDIFDGWGSYPDEIHTCPIFQGVFQCAREFYTIFQHHTTDPCLRNGMLHRISTDPDNHDYLQSPHTKERDLLLKRKNTRRTFTKKPTEQKDGAPLRSPDKGDICERIVELMKSPPPPQQPPPLIRAPEVLPQTHAPGMPAPSSEAAAAAPAASVMAASPLNTQAVSSQPAPGTNPDGSAPDSAERMHKHYFCETTFSGPSEEEGQKILQEQSAYVLFERPNAISEERFRLDRFSRTNFSWLKQPSDTLAILAIDNRLENCLHHVLKPSTWTKIFEELEKLPPTVQQLLMVLTVPAVYPYMEAVEKALLCCDLRCVL
jgi:hypothetical protein